MPSSIGETFGRQLRAHRQRLDLTQAELAERLTKELGSTIDASALARIEKGQRGVRLDEAVLLARILQVTLASMLAVDGDEVHQFLALTSERLQVRTRIQQIEVELKQAHKELERVEHNIAVLEETYGPPFDQDVGR